MNVLYYIYIYSHTYYIYKFIYLYCVYINICIYISKQLSNMNNYLFICIEDVNKYAELFIIH